VTSIRKTLDQEGFNATTLIGFAGAPWTIACYMVDGGGSKEFPATRTMAYQRESEFQHLIDQITDATCVYLAAQIRAGAEAVQIFDSWAGLMPEAQFRKWVIAPTKKIVRYLKQHHPEVPVIGFPRQAGEFYNPYILETGVTAVGIDTQLPVSWAAEHLQKKCPVQGNLDPFALMAMVELYDATKNPQYLEAARTIGNNIVREKFHRGFFVQSE
jgi:uroporphyrinogen decarboxylase